MTHAMYRIPLDAVRSTPLSSERERTSRGPLQRCDNSAAAAQVLGTALAFGTDASAAASGGAPSSNVGARFDTAVRLYEGGHWEQAFATLAALADHGDARAAKLALLMLRYGAPLYGTTFVAKPLHVARWAQRVLRASARATASPSSITAIA